MFKKKKIKLSLYWHPECTSSHVKIFETISAKILLKGAHKRRSLREPTTEKIIVCFFVPNFRADNVLQWVFC